jgi:hypothetical protein
MTSAAATAVGRMPTVSQSTKGLDMRTSIITTIRFEIEHDSEVSDKQDVYNFLAANTGFHDAFVGATDGEFTIVDADVIDDDIDDMNYDSKEEAA